MRLSPPVIWLTLLPLLIGAVAGCPADEETGTVGVISTTPRPRRTIAPSTGLGMAVATGSPTVSTSPTPTPSPPPTPKVVSAIVANPLFINLYLLPTDTQAGLGLPTQATLSAYARRADGSIGAVSWSDRSGGMLTVSASGSVSVKTTTSTGSYYVRAQSLDDPNQYTDVSVQVGALGEIDVTIQ